MRIGFVAGWLNLGGTTTYLLNLCNGLRSLEVDVRVFSLAHSNPLEQDFANSGIDVIAQDERRLILDDRLRSVWEGLRAFEPDVVVAWVGTSAYEILRYVPAKVTRLLALHGDKDLVYEQAQPYASFADTVVGVSQRMAARLASMPEVTTAKAAAIPPTIQVLSAPMRDHNATRPLRIMYLGRLDHDEKRVTFFPAIFRVLCDAGIPFTWSIVGDGPARPELQRQMTSSRSDQQICFTADVPPSAIAALLGDHDVLLLTSETEGLPLSLLEAMSCGVVPVVSDIQGGIREVVTPDCGRLVDPSNPENYAADLLWLDSHRDALASMSHYAEVKVRGQFTPLEIARRWLALASPPQNVNPLWPARFRFCRPLVHPFAGAFVAPRFLRRLAKQFRAAGTKRRVTIG